MLHCSPQHVYFLRASVKYEQEAQIKSGLELQFELCKNGYSRSSSPLSYTRAAFQQRTENPCFLPSIFRLFIQPRTMGEIRRIKIVCKKSVANCMRTDHWCTTWMLDWRIKKWVSVIWEKAGRCYCLASPMSLCGNFWSLDECRKSFPGSRNPAAAAQSPAGWFYSNTQDSSVILICSA